eukprot:RCo008075
MHHDEIDSGSDVHFFNVLWKRKANHASPLDSLEIKIPHTIVYEHDFAKGWFSMLSNSEGPKRRVGKDIDSKTVISTYCKNVPENPPIVGYYLQKGVDDGLSPDGMRVQYFDRQQFSAWLTNPRHTRSNKEPRHGLLQKFIPGTGRRSEMIQVSWTPYVTLMEKRQNIHDLSDTRLSLYDRCVTYEGPATLSIMTHMSPKTVEDLSKICQAIVMHTQSVEHKLVQRMQLYFKLDSEQHLWLLYPTVFELHDFNMDGSLTLTSPHFTRNASPSPQQQQGLQPPPQGASPH